MAAGADARPELGLPYRRCSKHIPLEVDHKRRQQQRGQDQRLVASHGSSSGSAVGQVRDGVLNHLDKEVKSIDEQLYLLLN